MDGWTGGRTDRRMLSLLRVPRCLCLRAVKPVVPRCSVPEAVTVGTSTELRCLENEGFPASQYRWFHNDEELPQDSKTNPKFINSSYSINPDTGGLVRPPGPGPGTTTAHSLPRVVYTEKNMPNKCMSQTNVGDVVCITAQVQLSLCKYRRLNLNKPWQCVTISWIKPREQI